MIVDFSKENEKVANVAITMAIEKMYLSREFIDEVLKASKEEKSLEGLRQKVIKKYAR